MLDLIVKLPGGGGHRAVHAGNAYVRDSAVDIGPSVDHWINGQQLVDPGQVRRTLVSVTPAIL